MQLASRFANSEAYSSRVLNLFLIVVLLTAFTFVEASVPEEALAAPALDVTTSVSKPLLGGIAHVEISATNTGPDKGYNLSFDTTVSASVPPTPTAGKVTILNPSVPPTIQSTDPTNHDVMMSFYDLTDLAPGESYTLSFDVDISNNPNWEVGDLVIVESLGYVNDVPDSSGTWRYDSANAQAEVIPIDLVSKTVNQSTQEDQASGTSTRQFSYTITVQNNYVNPSASVVVTDTIPDGIDVFTPSISPACDAGFPTRDPVTGETHLQWTLGTMAPGAAQAITYDVGIRYDYYGTANGGNNDTSPTAGAPVPHDTTFPNTATLESEYRGSLPATITPTDSDSASVTGVYMTLDKTASPTDVGYGDIVTYTLRYYTSEYYSTDQMTLTDTLGDGLTYVPGSSSVAPDTITTNPDGTTTLVWLPSTIGTITSSVDASLTLQASVDTTWTGPPLTNQPIRAGDSMSNSASITATWHDLVNPPREGVDGIQTGVDAGVHTRIPGIEKSVWNPDLGSWTDTITAQVGDEMLYRLRFNTTDGATPERSDISLGYIAVTDWIPPGTVVSSYATPTVSDWGDFNDATYPTTRSANPTIPVSVTLGSLQGYEWFLGDVAADGWWETTFTVTVVDAPEVQDGLKTGNHWKLTGSNSAGDLYSDRAIVEIEYQEPHLVLDKTASPTSGLVPGDVVTYTVEVTNDGLGDAEDVFLADWVPDFANDTTPAPVAVTLDGAPLTDGVDYVSAWTAATAPGTTEKQLSLDFYDTTATVDTPIPAGSTIEATFPVVIDDGVGAGAQLDNQASVSYDSHPGGTTRRVDLTTNNADDNTDNAVVTLAGLTITKSGPVGQRFRIGDTWTYELDVTVPAGAVAYDAQVVDRILADAIWYVSDSATLTAVSGTPTAGASFATTSTPNREQTGNNGRTDFRWTLSSPIDNSGSASDYVFRLAFDVQYTGVEDSGAQEFWLPGTTNGNRLRNAWAQMRWNDTPGSGGHTAQSNQVDSRVDQPLLAQTKTAASPGPYVGGQVVTYTATITNTQPVSMTAAVAYDLWWDDILDPYLTAPALVSVSHSASGSILASVTPDFTTTPTMTIDFNSITLAPQQTVDIVYTAIVEPTVPASTICTNTADIDWSSLPGTPPGSRRYDDQPWESGYTADTAVETIPVASPIIDKTIVSGNPATIGDTVTYNLRVTVPPETSLPNAYLEDVTDEDGMLYTGAPAPTISSVSGTPSVPASLMSVTVTSTSPAPGSTLTAMLTPPGVVNAGGVGVGDTPYVFDFTFSYVVDGLDDTSGWVFFPPTASDQIGDTGSISWTSGGTPISISDVATLDVEQPLLALDKNVITGPPYLGGDSIVYETTIENVGWSTAYDLDWQDVIASEMSTATLLAVSTSTSGSVIASVTPDFSSEPTLSIDFGSVSLSPGATATVLYSVEIDPGAGSGSYQTNTADVDWSSLPGTPANSRRYDDGPEESGWTSDTDTETIQIQIPDLLKSVESGDTTRTIGESFYYQIDFSVPASTTAYNIFIDDLVPNGLSVTGTQIVNGPATTVTVSPRNVLGQTPVVWDVGDVTNPPDEVLTLRIFASVDETYAVSGLPVNGLVPQDTVTNRARITWDDADTGGTTRTREDSKTVTIEEPNLTIDKVSSETTLQAGQSTTYTVTIANTGTSAAHEFEWTDAIAAELFSAGSSPALVSVTLDASAPTSYTTDFGTTPTSTVVIDDPIPAGSTVVITYTATMNGGLSSGIPMPNTATIEQYASLPDTDSARFYGPVSDTETVTSTAPELQITKVVSGDQQIQEGQTTSFTVTITNIGDAPAYSVRATDTAPSPPFVYVGGSTSASWPSGSSTADPSGTAGSQWVWDFGGSADLAPGQALTLVYESQAPTGTPTGSYDNNLETVADDGVGIPIPSVNDTATVLVTDPELQITKQLAAGQDPFVQVGEQVSYDIAVTNSGDTTMTSVPLQDTYEEAYLTLSSASPSVDSTSPDTLAWNDITGPGVLGVGAVTTVTVTFDVIGHPATSSSDDTATVSGAVDVFGDSPADVSDTETIGITDPRLDVSKTRSTVATARVGDTVSFEIVVTNAGDTTLTSIPATDTYDASAMLFTSALPVETTASTGTITWADVTGAGVLAPGEATTITVTYRALNEAIPTTNTFTILDGAAIDVNGDGAIGDTDSDTVDVVEPNLITGKSFSDATIGPGESTTVSVGIQNTGSGPAYDIDWYDTIPTELFSAGSSPTTPTLTLNGAPLTAGADYTFDFSSSTTVTIDFLIPLDPTDVVVIEYEVTLNGGLPAGLSLVNTAVISEYSSLPGTVPGEAYYGPVSAVDTIMTRAPALTLDKWVVGDTEIQYGQEVSFAVELANAGDAPAYSLVITDTLPPGTIYSAGSALVTYSYGPTATLEPSISGQELVWDLGAMSVLPPSENVTITFRSLVTSAAPVGTALNTAIGGANDGASVPTTPAIGYDSFLVTVPSHSASKHLAVGQDQHIQVGETVTFDIVLENDGTTTITAMPLIDTFDTTYLSFNGAVPAPDSTVPAGILTWNDLSGGAFPPGDTTTVTVTFTAIAHPPTSYTTNRATAPTATDEWGDLIPPTTDTADIGITDPSVSVSKALAASQASTVSVGATVDFDLVFTNSGDTTLTSIPATDTFVFGELTYVSATPSADTTGPGFVAWNDVTGAGSLPPGDSTTVTVTFRALNEAIPTTDTVTVLDDAATDINGDPATGDTASADVAIVEPNLTVAKTMEPGAVGPGESVVATVTIQNTGTGPAYDTMWSDVLPSELTSAGTTIALITVTRNGTPLIGGGIDYTADFSGTPTVTIDFATPINPADTVRIVYTMALQGGTPAGLTLTNNATIDEYSSLPGTDPYERIYGPVSASDSVDTLAPELALSKAVIGDLQLQRGQEVQFRVIMTNTGSAPAYNPVVTDTLPPGVEYSWGSSLVTYSTGTTAALEPAVMLPVAVWDMSVLGALPPSETITIDFRGLVTNAAPLGVATNAAEGRALDGGNWPVAPATSTASFLITDPSQTIDKHLQTGQDTHIQVGQDVTFEIVVTNDGTTDIVTAPLTDTFDPTYLSFDSAAPAPDSTAPTGTLSWNDITGGGSMAVGDSATITVTFTAIAHPATSMTMDRAVAETGTDEFGDPVPSVEDTSSIGITDPSVDVTKTLSAGEGGVYAIGDVVSYDIGFTNSGDTRIVSLPATDTFDAANLAFVSSMPAPTAVATGAVVWNDLTTTLGDLDVGETVTATVQFEIIGAMASVMNTATVLDGSAIDENGDGARGGMDTQPIDTYDPADIGFVKTAEPPAESIVLPGDVITYSIELANHTAITLPSTVITDTVPNEVTYNAETMSMTRGATTTALTDAADADAGTYESATGPQGTMRYALGDVSPGETITVTFDVTVRPEEYSRQGIQNWAYASANGDPLAEYGPVNHHVDPFDIIKTGEDINGGNLEAGDEILWTITVTNTGLTPTTHVIVYDEVPPETTYVSGSITGRGADDSNAPDLVWQVGTMDVDETVVLTFKSSVNSGLPAGTSIENQAWVVSDQSLPKYSDFPDTSVVGDPTLLQTGANDWIWLALAMMLAAGGYALATYGRRRSRLQAT